MARFNKGQQALEYIVTYGWAFVVVLLTIGAFAYFGFLNPDKYLPDRCNFGNQLECVDFLLEARQASNEQGRVHLKFVNNFGENIVILNAETIEGYGDFCDATSPGATPTCPPSSGQIPLENGRTNVNAVVLDLKDTNNLEYILVDGDKTLIPIRITFSRDPADVPNPPTHVVIGEVYARAQE